MYYILFLFFVIASDMHYSERTCLFTLPIYLIILLRIYVFNGG